MEFIDWQRVRGNFFNMLDADGVQQLAKNIPNICATKSLDWFTYCDNTIDGQSRKKAYTLW